MNKKLVAVAVAGLLAAPLAAQAQTANVTLYGRLNLTMEAVNGQAVDPNLPASAAPVNRTLWRVNSNSSRLGVRGSESLGGGLSAIFQIESSVNADISGGVLASRETFVGLQGTWGTFKMGYFLAPYDDIHPIFGNVPTLTTSILSTANLWAQGSQNNDNGGFDNRVANSIRYDSPRIGGFTGSVQIGAYDFSPASGGGGTTFGTDAQAKRHAYVGSTGGFYSNGPFQAGIAYQWNEKLRGPSLNDYALSVAANWNFGVVKIGGVYERLDYDVLNNSDLTRNFYAISAHRADWPGRVVRDDRYGPQRLAARRARRSARSRQARIPAPRSGRFPTRTRCRSVRLLYAASFRRVTTTTLRTTSTSTRTRWSTAPMPMASRWAWCTSSKSRNVRLSAEFAMATGALGRPFFLCSVIPLRHARFMDRRLRPRAAHADRIGAVGAADSRRRIAGTRTRRPTSAGMRRGLMRVNHTGEVCAQALYAAQALVARDPGIAPRFAAAAREEEEHLAWTQSRLAELHDRPSLLNPAVVRRIVRHRRARGARRRPRQPGIRRRDRAPGRGASHHASRPAARSRCEEPRDRRYDARRRGAAWRDGAGSRRHGAATAGARR